MRACVLIFGLDRSGRWTWDSIAERIIAPCVEAFDQVKIFARLNVVSALNNPRSKEMGTELRAGTLSSNSALFDSYKEDIQESLPPDDMLDELCTIPDQYRDGHASYRNIVHVLGNQGRLWADVVAHGCDDADVFVIIRPDLFYMTALPVGDVIKSFVDDQADLLIPDWHHFGGLNDRFAVANARAARIYLQRGESLRNHVREKKTLRSERFLQDVVTKAELKVSGLDMLALRVRASGKIAPRDLLLLKERQMKAPLIKITGDGAVGKAGINTQVVQNSVSRIAALFEGRPLGRYLEIGVQRGVTFTQVQAAEKVAVDPKFRFRTSKHAGEGIAYFECTSDDYFCSRWDGKKFDLIFIDGLHVFEQALRDFCNALTAAHRGTIIILDDTIPSDVFSSLRTQDRAVAMRESGGGVGRAWHGDVFKLVYFIHDFCPTLSYATINTGGNPQTIVWFEPRKDAQPLFKSLEQISRTTYFDLLEQMEIMNCMPEEEAIVMARRILSST